MSCFNSVLNKYKIIIVCMTFFIAISFLFTVILVVGNNKKQSEKTGVTHDENFSQGELLSGDSNFLVVCNDEKIGDSIFMAVVNFKIFSSEIVISILDKDTLAENKTYREIYAYGGINDLISAVENVRKCKLDRYIIIDKLGIGKIIDIMGNPSLVVTESYTYESSDHSYFVEKGTNELDGAMFFSYLKILSTKSNSEQLISDLLSTVINEYLSEIDAINTLDMFENLSNCFKSNLTIADYYSCEADIKYLLEHNAKCIVY